MALLQINNLSKEYVMGDNVLRALDAVNLSIERSDYVAITGTSGSGKSTMLNILVFTGPANSIMLKLLI